MKDFLAEIKKCREEDAKTFNEIDSDLCMLCHAYGEDKRSLFIDCFYNVKEVIPEALDLFACGDKFKARGYYLRLCKGCRGALLGILREWRDERVSLRGAAKKP